MTGLPHPIDWLALLGLTVSRIVLWLIVTPARHVAELGPWWPPCWAAAIAGLWTLGTWGATRGDILFRGGEDVAAFGSRAEWLGLGGRVIRARKHADAAISGTAVLIGWGGATLLYTVALLWWLCLPLLAGVGWWHWWRLQPRPWERS